MVVLLERLRGVGGRHGLAVGRGEPVDQLDLLERLRMMAQRAQEGGTLRRRAAVEHVLEAPVLLVDEGEIVGEQLPALHRPEGPDGGQEGHLEGAEEHERELRAQRHRAVIQESVSGSLRGVGKRMKAIPSSTGRSSSGPNTPAGEIGRCRRG